MYFDGTHVTILVAFLAGFITFFASCLLPLVPTYLAYLSGVALKQPRPDTDRPTSQPRIILITAAFFVTGFILAFMALGVLAYHFSAALLTYKLWLERLAGVVFIVLGLMTLGVFQTPLLTKEYKLDVSKILIKHRNLHALAAGVGFGLGWSPCIGPVLAVILFWASRQESMWGGMGLLFVYGLGLGLPFLLVAAAFERIMPLLKKSARFTQYLTLVSGVILVSAGVLLLLGRLGDLSMLFVSLFNLSHLSI